MIPTSYDPMLGDYCKVIHCPPPLCFGSATPRMEWTEREELPPPLEMIFQLVPSFDREVENEVICYVLACLELGLRKIEWLPVVRDEPTCRKHAQISEGVATAYIL